MKKKVAMVLILILVFQTISVTRTAAADPFRDLAARSALLAEKDTGKILFSNNMYARHPADGLTKIMTLLLAAYAVENDEISDNELIVMTESAWHDIEEDSSPLDIQPGEEMTFIDLMYCSYVGNSDEASNMLALRIAGNIDAFVAMMNAKVAEFGISSTRFVNPHGQYHENQYTTAYDMYVIYSEAIKSALFTEVASTFRHVTEGTEEFESHVLSTSNALINPSSRYYFRHCESGRDSATYEGGHSLIAYSEDEGLSLISVVLGSDIIIFEDESTEMRHFSETIRLFLWGYNQFSWRDILKTTDLLARVPVMHGSGADFVNARPETSLTLLLENSVPNEAFTREITIYSEENDEPLIAPVNAGDVLGEVIITRDGVEYARTSLIANTDISLNSFEFMRRQVMAMIKSDTARNVMFALGALVLLYVALVVRYNIVRANRLRRIKNAKNDIIRERHQNFRD